MFEELDELVIVEGEDDIGNLYLFDFHVLVTTLGLLVMLFDELVLLAVLYVLEFLVEQLLEVRPEVVLEDDGHGLIALAGVDVRYKVFVHLLSDFHLHRVVTRGDGEHVPLDLVELAVALEPVQHGQVDKDHEDAEASDLRGHLVLLEELLRVLLASETHENSGLLVHAVVRLCRKVVTEHIGVLIAEQEESLALSLLILRLVGGDDVFAKASAGLAQIILFLGLLSITNIFSLNGAWDDTV